MASQQHVATFSALLEAYQPKYLNTLLEFESIVAWLLAQAFSSCGINDHLLLLPYISQKTMILALLRHGGAISPQIIKSVASSRIKGLNPIIQRPLGLGLPSIRTPAPTGRLSFNTLVRRASSSSEEKSIMPAIGDIPPGNNGPGGSGGNGGDGDDGGSSSSSTPIATLLAGKALESLPVDLAVALKQGQLPPEMLQRYLDLQKNFFLSWLSQFPYVYAIVSFLFFQ